MDRTRHGARLEGVRPYLSRRRRGDTGVYAYGGAPGAAEFVAAGFRDARNRRDERRASGYRGDGHCGYLTEMGSGSFLVSNPRGG